MIIVYRVCGVHGVRRVYRVCRVTERKDMEKLINIPLKFDGLKPRIIFVCFSTGDSKQIVGDVEDAIVLMDQNKCLIAVELPAKCRPKVGTLEIEELTDKKFADLIKSSKPICINPACVKYVAEVK